MIISFTTLKGGTGKSTLSSNIAVCLAHIEYKVCIIDTDTNGSCIRWSGFRPDDLPEVTVISLPDAKALRNNINRIHKDYEVIIIDGTPHLSELTSTIILVSDLVISPVKPSALDLWATEKFLSKYEDARLLKDNIKACFVINQYKANTLLSKEVEEALKEFDIPILTTKISDRVAYSEAVMQGIGVLEYKDQKAKNEVINLTNEIIEIIKT